MDKGRIAMIVEGTRREEDYIACLKEMFLTKGEVEVFCLPADQNIYMLWSKLQEDDFETEIIDLVKECSDEAKDRLQEIRPDYFNEVYLFFDFDIHQDNLPKGKNGIKPYDVIKQMLETFDNETENGKLYISYPMIEALRDITEWSCVPYYQCTLSVSDSAQYKEKTGNNKAFPHVKKYNKDIWNMIVAIFFGAILLFAWPTAGSIRV